MAMNEGRKKGKNMSVLIKDMEMPDKCLNCPMYDKYNHYCNLYAFGIPARYNYDDSTRPEWCGLVGLPKNHGRLIDADELLKTLDMAISMQKMIMKGLDVEDDAELKMQLKSYQDIRISGTE